MENPDDNAPWICNVSLIKRYVYVNVPNKNPETGEVYPLYPWIEKETITTFLFATLRDKTDLENTIRRAQFATLNPEHDPAEFRNANLNLLHFGVPFSPNVISLEVMLPPKSKASVLNS
jgi:hypothetical protein